MAWTQEHQDLLQSYASHFGLPHLDGASAREWTRNLAEQFRWSFPGEGGARGWGTKQADSGRPQSTDCICTAVPFLGYDVIINQGTPEQHLASFPEPLNLQGQIFIVVEPVNHLAGGTPAPIPPPTPTYPSYEALGGDKGGVAISTAMEADYKRAGRPGLDGGCGAWMQRTCYDFLTGKYKTVEESIAFHRAEWCAELGIPVA